MIQHEDSIEYYRVTSIDEAVDASPFVSCDGIRIVFENDGIITINRSASRYWRPGIDKPIPESAYRAAVSPILAELARLAGVGPVIPDGFDAETRRMIEDCYRDEEQP